MRYLKFEHALARAFDEGEGPSYGVVWTFRLIIFIALVMAANSGPVIGAGFFVMAWAASSFFGSFFGIGWIAWPAMMFDDAAKYRKGLATLADVKGTALVGVWFFGWVPILLAMFLWVGGWA